MDSNRELLFTRRVLPCCETATAHIHLEELRIFLGITLSSKIVFLHWLLWDPKKYFYSNVGQPGYLELGDNEFLK